MHKLKRYLLWSIVLTLASLLFFSTWQLRYNLVENIRLLEGETHYVNFRLPFVYIQGDRSDILKLNGDDLPWQPGAYPPLTWKPGVWES